MTRDELIEAIGRLTHPSVWADDLPIPTRAATVAFHQGRQESNQRVSAVLAAIESSGYVVMPREMTEAESKAMRKAAPKYWKDSHGSDEWFLAVRRAMIEAGKV